MYSVFFLGIIMIMDGFGFHVPAWLSPIITFGVVGYFLLKSLQEMPEGSQENNDIVF